MKRYNKGKCNKGKNSGQIEIAGLLIIVVLVSLVLMFVLTFNVKDKENRDAPQQRAKESQIRDNFGPVLLETSTDCEDNTLRDLLADCGYVKEINCMRDGSKVDSCKYSKYVIDFILEKTLKKYGFNYILKVNSDSKSRPILEFDNGCDTSGSTFVPAITPFQTNFGTMSLTIVQCS